MIFSNRTGHLRCRSLRSCSHSHPSLPTQIRVSTIFNLDPFIVPFVLVLDSHTSPCMSISADRCSLFLEDPLGKLPHPRLMSYFSEPRSVCVHTVPSIATEYLRNRVQHDRTARRWTELYARSPASVPAPSPIASTSTSSTRVPTPTSTSTSTPTTSTSTTQASGSRKGKSRTSTNQPAHGSGSSNVLAETIDISDSDDELSQSPPTRKRPRGTPNEVDIDLVEAEQRSARRRRTGGGGSLVPSFSRGSRGSGSIVGAGEVIVIDD